MRVIHYPADWLARGGPNFSGPTVNTTDPYWSVEAAAVALAGLGNGHWQVVHVHTGQVLCEASCATEAVDYLTEYAQALDEEARSWKTK